LGIIGREIGIQTGVREHSSSVSPSPVFEDTRQVSVTQCYCSRSANPCGEGGCGPVTASFLTRILQQCVHCLQEGLGQTTSCDKSQSFKSTASQTSIQDGNPDFNYECSSSGRLDRQYRPDRCLSPHTDAPVYLEVPSVRLGTEGVRVQGVTVRPVSSSVRLHEGDGDHLSSCPQQDVETVSLSRRLSPEESGSPTSSLSAASAHKLVRFVRLPEKRQEIVTDSIPTLHLPRGILRSSAGVGKDSGRKVVQDIIFDPPVFELKCTLQPDCGAF
jgi:hypothetical protein